MTYKTSNNLWYILFFAFLATLLSMHPFMKFPFDMYRHLLRIDDFYSHTEKIPNVARFHWHYTWSKIFHLLNLDSSKLFERAYIIHYTNTIISFFSIFFFSLTVFKYTLFKSNKLTNRYLALWSTFIWFTIYATSSVGWHLTWIQWYSINYQISLPLTFLAIAILIHAIFGEFNYKIKILLIIINFALLYLIANIHSMEIVYFLLYLITIFIVFIDKVFIYVKKHKIIFLIIITLLIFSIFNISYIIHGISYKEPLLIKYISSGDFNLLWQKIIEDGNALITRFNRASASMNELIYLSLSLLPLLIIFSYLQTKKYNKIFNIRTIVFIVITSLFVLIPVFKITAGLASLVTYLFVVNRFYYSSSIFLVIPLLSWIIIYFITKKNKILYINILIALIISSTYIYSKYAKDTNQNYYKNIQSIKNSFNKRIVSFNLTKKQIETIGKLANRYKNSINKEPYFYAREDIAFVLKYIYLKDVYNPFNWQSRIPSKDVYTKAYKEDIQHKNKILFKIPKGFPKYEPYK